MNFHIKYIKQMLYLKLQRSRYSIILPGQSSQDFLSPRLEHEESNTDDCDWEKEMSYMTNLSSGSVGHNFKGHAWILFNFEDNFIQNIYGAVEKSETTKQRHTSSCIETTKLKRSVLWKQQRKLLTWRVCMYDWK